MNGYKICISDKVAYYLESIINQGSFFYVQGDPKRCVPIKISIVTLIKKLFISNYNHTLFSL